MRLDVGDGVPRCAAKRNECSDQREMLPAADEGATIDISMMAVMNNTANFNVVHYEAH
jgi:hypothetical protein